MSLKVSVISAGIGVPSSSRMLADAISSAVEFNEPTSLVKTWELRNYATDITNALVAGFTSDSLLEVIEDVANTDILIVVSPVFKASYSGLFKSFFDILDNNLLEGKTVILGATGGSNRHSMVLDLAMRPLFTYMRSQVVPTAIYAAPEDWGNTLMSERIDKAAKEALNGGQVKERRIEAPLESDNFEDMLAAIKRSI